ncbi:MAG: hypothetical protein JW746_05295 [Candidatus Krumholzibacteriota bacterium]|nr:hypothetical protein [Candidatus Krumholzibacteriota bacterium]
MRYLIATAVLLVIVINPLFFAGTDACAKENSEFSKWAKNQSDAVDRDWQKAVTRSSVISSRKTGPAGWSTGIERSSQEFRRPAALAGNRNMRQQRTGWSADLKASGYTHKGISGSFMPQTSRTRNGASRGTGMMASPSSIVRGGNRRQTVNPVNININTSVRRGSMRNSPGFGSRFSSSTRRSRSSSFGSLGSTRTRKSR